MRELKPADLGPLGTRWTVVEYGLAGVGKSLLASAHPSPNKVLIAAEPSAQRLTSWVGPPPVHIVIPDGNWNPVTKTLDWRRETFALCQRDWAAEFGPDVVVIWDGWTNTNTELLHESARKNWFSEKKPVSGPQDPKTEEASKYAQPQPGDYNMAQQLGLQAIEFLIKQPISVIVVTHECLAEADAAKGNLALYGPQTVGQKGPRQFPHRFDACLWMTREKASDNPDAHVKVHFKTTEKHVARINTPKPELVPEFKYLKTPAEATALWEWMMTLKA